MAESSGEVTQLLEAMRSGDQQARDRLIERVYPELKRLAIHHLAAERPNHTLQATALVHEAYMKLLAQQEREWANRAHFFAVAARVMRQVLVDHARGRRSEKRGGAARQVELSESAVVAHANMEEILAVDEALNRLELIDRRQAQVIELRYFSGSTVEEVAEGLGISTRTVKRESAMGLAWLYRELSGAKSGESANP